MEFNITTIQLIVGELQPFSSGVAITVLSSFLPCGILFSMETHVMIKKIFVYMKNLPKRNSDFCVKKAFAHLISCKNKIYRLADQDFFEEINDIDIFVQEDICIPENLCRLRIWQNYCIIKIFTVR